MFRELLYSGIGHTIVFGSLIALSFINGKSTIQLSDVYRVQVVSSQAIADLMQRNEPTVAKPNRKVIQIQTEQKPLPTEHRKESQPVKSSTEQASTTSVTKSASNKEQGVSGIKTDTVFNYPEYLLEMRDKIQQNWYAPKMNETVATRVFFKIGRDGKILRVFVEKPTGYMGFDASAMKAVVSCDPFAPLPEEYKNDNLGVHFDFIYETN